MSMLHLFMLQSQLLVNIDLKNNASGELKQMFGAEMGHDF